MSLIPGRPVRPCVFALALSGAALLLTGCPASGTSEADGSAVSATTEQAPAVATDQAVAPASAEAGSGSGAGPSAALTATECVLTQAEQLIENVRLRSADGACTALIPYDMGVGELPVRASASAATVSVEANSSAGTLFATDGTFVVTQAEGGRLVGTFEAEDQSPPAVGRLTGSFDVSLSPAAP
ncbi:MAG: hypothetical protein KGO50_00685 [Myxococcales bacterium]|nr:hypothetical protein [Myxococcales bacterium]